MDHYGNENRLRLYCKVEIHYQILFERVPLFKLIKSLKFTGQPLVS